MTFGTFLGLVILGVVVAAALAQLATHAARRLWAADQPSDEILARAPRVVRWHAIIALCVAAGVAASLVNARFEPAAMVLLTIAAPHMVALLALVDSRTRPLAAGISRAMAVIWIAVTLIVLAFPSCTYGGCGPVWFLMLLNWTKAAAPAVRLVLVWAFAGSLVLLFSSALVLRAVRAWSTLEHQKIISQVAGVIIPLACLAATPVVWRMSALEIRDTARPLRMTKMRNPPYWWDERRAPKPDPPRWWLDDADLPVAASARYLPLERRDSQCEPIPFGPPAVGGDGSLYVQTASALHAVDRALRLKWYRPDSAANRQPTVARDGTIYVEGDGREHGGVRRFSPGGDALGALTDAAFVPAVATNGALYAARRDGSVAALDTSGTLIWRYDIPAPAGKRGTLEARPPVPSGRAPTIMVGPLAVGSDGIVYTYVRTGAHYTLRSGGEYTDIENWIYAIQPDGVRLWRHQFGPFRDAVHALVPAAAGGVYVLRTSSITELGEDPRTWVLESPLEWSGTTTWLRRTSHPLVVAANGDLFMLRRLHLRAENIELVAFKSDGVLLWRLPLVTYREYRAGLAPRIPDDPPLSRMDAGPVIARDGTVLVVVNERIRAIRRDGRPLWTSNVLARRVLPQSLTLGDDGMIYLLVETAQDCVGLQAISAPPGFNHGGSGQGWPKYGGDAHNSWRASRERSIATGAP